MGRCISHIDRYMDINIKYIIAYILNIGVEIAWMDETPTALISPGHLPSFYAALRIIRYALSIIGLPSYVFMKRFSL